MDYETEMKKQIADILMSASGLLAKEVTKEHIIDILTDKPVTFAKVEFDNPISTVCPPYGWSGQRWNEVQIARETLKEGEYLDLDNVVAIKTKGKNVNEKYRLFSKDKERLTDAVKWIDKNDNYEEAMADLEDPKDLAKRIIKILSLIHE